LHIGVVYLFQREFFVCTTSYSKKKKEEEKSAQNNNKQTNSTTHTPLLHKRVGVPFCALACLLACLDNTNAPRNI